MQAARTEIGQYHLAIRHRRRGGKGPILMMPFVLTIVAMALVSRNARAPAALLVPFRKEER